MVVANLFSFATRSSKLVISKNDRSVNSKVLDVLDNNGIYRLVVCVTLVRMEMSNYWQLISLLVATADNRAELLRLYCIKHEKVERPVVLWALKSLESFARNHFNPDTLSFLTEE